MIERDGVTHHVDEAVAVPIEGGNYGVFQFVMEGGGIARAVCMCIPVSAVIADRPSSDPFDASLDPPAVENTQRRNTVHGSFHATCAGGFQRWFGSIQPHIDTRRDQLTRNGTLILKFFLHLSKEQQRRRLLKRIDDPTKHWKFSVSDITERGHWDEYMTAFEEAISRTSTLWAPWYVIPADRKWVTRALVARIVAKEVQALDLHYPKTTPEMLQKLAEAKRQLEAKG